MTNRVAWRLLILALANQFNLHQFNQCVAAQLSISIHQPAS